MHFFRRWEANPRVLMNRAEREIKIISWICITSYLTRYLCCLLDCIHPQHVLVLCCASHTDTTWASAYLTALGFSLLPTTDVVGWILALKRLARLSPTNQRSIAPVFSPTCVREISTSRRLHDDLFSRLSQSASRSLKCRCPALPSVVPSSARCPGMDSQS